MAENTNCENCAMRAKYDQNPKSFGGRFWRWHIGFCPGWKAYMLSLDDGKRKDIAIHYNLKKWQTDQRISKTDSLGYKIQLSEFNSSIELFKSVIIPENRLLK